MDTYKTTFSGYQRLLNDPFSEPVSGVPNEFGERTRKIRVRVREMVVADANDVKFKCMPHAGVANDVDVVRIEGGHVLGTPNSYLRTSSDYANSDLSDSLRGRLVSARLRVTSTHAASNGTLYACSDPAREDIGGLTNEEIERRFSKGNMAVGRASEESMQILYRPTLEEEVEGWVTDATKAPYEFARDITATEYPCSHMITWSGNNAAGDQIITGSGVTVEAYAPGDSYQSYVAGATENGYMVNGAPGRTQETVLKLSEMIGLGEQGYDQFSYQSIADIHARQYKILFGRGYVGLVQWYNAAFPWSTGTFTNNYRSNTSFGDDYHTMMITLNNEAQWGDYSTTVGCEWPYAQAGTPGNYNYNVFNPTSGIFQGPISGGITIDYGWQVPSSTCYPQSCMWYYLSSDVNAGFQPAGTGNFTAGVKYECPEFRTFGPVKMIIWIGYNLTNGGSGSFNQGFSNFTLEKICSPGSRLFHNAPAPSAWGLGPVPNQHSLHYGQVTTQGALTTGVNQGEPIEAFSAEAQTEAKPQKFWVEFDAVYELSGDEVITDATPNPPRGGESIVAYYDTCSSVRKVGAGKREFDELDRGDKVS